MSVKISLPTFQKVHRVYITKTTNLMLFIDIFHVSYENLIVHIKCTAVRVVQYVWLPLCGVINLRGLVCQDVLAVAL